MTRTLGLSGALVSLVAVAALGFYAPVSGESGPKCGGKSATIVGTARSDRLHGTAGADVIVARAGADHIEGRGGKDVICGNRGKDVARGDRGNDRLYGGHGFDRAKGGRGRDVCRAEVTRGCRAGAIWGMDETTGRTMADSSGNRNDGTTYNITMQGKNGYLFHPADRSKVVVPSSPTLNPRGRTFSYSVQMRSSHVPARGTDYDLLRKGIGSTPGGEYKLEIVESNGQGRAFCLVKDSHGNMAIVKGTTNISDGKVHKLTCTKTASRLKLKVDALPTRTRKVTSRLGSISNTSPLVVGAKSPTSKGSDEDWYDGALLKARLRIR